MLVYQLTSAEQLLLHIHFTFKFIDELPTCVCGEAFWKKPTTKQLFINLFHYAVCNIPSTFVFYYALRFQSTNLDVFSHAV